MNQIPDARLLPIPQAAPAGHSRAAAQFPGEHLPRDAGSKYKYNSPQTSSIGYARASALRLVSRRRQKRSDQAPQIVGDQCSDHG
jgi:hypothetical protein